VKIGIRPDAPGTLVRGIRHFTECLVAMFPDEPDERCTCWDDSPQE
jgi:hypothetical protein